MFKSDTNPKAKLNRAQVFEIKTLLKKGLRANEIASQFNVHPSTICRIKKSLTWRSKDETRNWINWRWQS